MYVARSTEIEKIRRVFGSIRIMYEGDKQCSICERKTRSIKYFKWIDSKLTTTCKSCIPDVAVGCVLCGDSCKNRSANGKCSDCTASEKYRAYGSIVCFRCGCYHYTRDAFRRLCRKCESAYICSDGTFTEPVNDAWVQNTKEGLNNSGVIYEDGGTFCNIQIDILIPDQDKYIVIDLVQDQSEDETMYNAGILSDNMDAPLVYIACRTNTPVDRLVSRIKSVKEMSFISRGLHYISTI